MHDAMTRRKLTHLGLAGASAAVPSTGTAQASASAVPGRTYPADQRIGFGLVGVRKSSREQLIPAFRECESARPAALVSGDPAKAQRLATEQRLPARAIYDYSGFDRSAADPTI